MPNREPPWLCHSCGYMMDANTALNGKAVPKEDDISMCINCGALYSRHSDSWRPTTPAEFYELTPQARRELAAMQVFRGQFITTDLSKRDGKT